MIPTGSLTPFNEARSWLRRKIQTHFQPRGRQIQSTVILGQRATRIDFPPAAERIEAADLIVIPPPSWIDSGRRDVDPSRAKPLDAKNWPANDFSTLVIDLVPGGHPEAGQIRRSGYTLAGAVDRQIGCLCQSFSRWTGQPINEDLVADAVEEYLAV